MKKLLAVISLATLIAMPQVSRAEDVARFAPPKAAAAAGIIEIDFSR